LITTIVAFLFTLSVVIFFHELGHFLAAKWAGVRVERFSLGLGPKVFGKKIGETEYLLSCIPFGGYVKMAGDEPGQEKGEPYEFYSKSIRCRFIIILSGPVMNLLVGIILFTLVFLIGVQSSRIGQVLPTGPARDLGILPGDRIVEIDGEAIDYWGDLLNCVMDRPGKRVDLVFLRDGERYMRRVEIGVREVDVGKGREGVRFGFLGVSPYFGTRIGKVLEGFPAHSVGLRPGDRVLSVDGVDVKTWFDITSIVHKSPGRVLLFEIERSGERLRYAITPKEEEIKGERIGLVGIVPSQDLVRFSPITAIYKGIVQGLSLSGKVIVVLWRLLTLKMSLKLLAGPIGIAQMAGQVAQVGFSDLLSFIGLVSINLWVLNLLPIPVLDGGHLLFLGIERIRGERFDPKVMEVTQKVGVGILLPLILIVTYNDLSRIFGDLSGALGDLVDKAKMVIIELF
jgi:regulator of sigma E protease